MSRDLKEVRKVVVWMPREEYSRQRSSWYKGLNVRVYLTCSAKARKSRWLKQKEEEKRNR